MNNTAAEQFRKRIQGRWAFRAFLLFKLPLALLAGLRIESISADACAVSVPHGWRSTNPFKSTYFAALAMAAELSTGAMVMAELQGLPQQTGMLVKRAEAEFLVRATAKASFTCVGGTAIRAAVDEAVRTGEAVLLPLETVGRMPDGTEVARFVFTWSIVAKARV